MANYVPREIGLDHTSIPEGVSILFSTWTIKKDGLVVHYTERDEVNLTSKVFTDVFEIGETYYVTLSMSRTDGPTIETKPFRVIITATDDVYRVVHIPSVPDTPILTLAHEDEAVPNMNIMVNGSPYAALGNSVHDYTYWWLVDDRNNVIMDPVKDHLNLTSILLSSVSLSENKLYTLYAIYVGSNGDASGNGSVTFKVSDLMELSIIGGTEGIVYGAGLDTRLMQIDPNMSLFEYKVTDPQGTVLHSDSNATGDLTIPSQLPNATPMFGLDHEWYLLQLRVTINGSVIGWRDYYITPKELSIESTRIDENQIVYDAVDVFTDIPEGYDDSSWGLDNTMAGTTYQFPDGSIYLQVAPSQINRYTFDELAHTFTLQESNVAMDSRVSSNPTPNRTNMMLLPDLTCVVTLDGGEVGASEILTYRYNTTLKRFTFIKAFDLGNKDMNMCSTSEMFDVGDGKVLFMTGVSRHAGTVEDSADVNSVLYIIDTRAGTLTELDSGLTPGKMLANLIRLDDDTFIVSSGVDVGSSLSGANDLVQVITISTTRDVITVSDPVERYTLDFTDNVNYQSFRQSTLKNGETLLSMSANWMYDANNKGYLEILDTNKLSSRRIEYTIGKQAIYDSSTSPMNTRGGFLIALNSGARIILDNLAGPKVFFK